jgi:TolB protein
MIRRSMKGLAVPAVLAAVMGGCGGDGPTEPKFQSGINFVAGHSLTDTAMARPIQALVVEIRGDDRKPLAGVPVRFEGVGHPGGPQYNPQMEAYLVRVDGTQLLSFIADTTDAQGRVQALVQLGQVAGPARIVVTVPTLGVQDTARYTVTPASVYRVAVAPKDTLLYAGKSYTLRGSVVDRWGNRREDAVTYTASAGVTVDSRGAVSTGSVGRSFVVAQAQGRADTAWITIPPQGTLAAFSRRAGDNMGLVTVNLDGSGFRRLAVSSEYYGPDHMAPVWAPSGTEVVFQDGSYSSLRLFRVDMNGAVKRFLTTTPSGLSSENWPQYSRDGRWVYFHGPMGNPSSLLRAAADGTGATVVTTPAPSGYAYHPSPSPDGQRLAYVTTHSGTQVRILNLATGTDLPIAVSGNTPRWSPVEDLIAYRKPDETIGLMKADGSEQRTVSATGRRYDFGFNWSPDGEWLVARSNSTGSLDLINVKTGTTLPLPFSTGLSNPAWKP